MRAERKATKADRSRLLRQVVSDLRDVSVRARFLGGRVYFPSKDPGETQPATLEGYVDLERVAELLHYVADMLEE